MLLTLPGCKEKEYPQPPEPPSNGAITVVTDKARYNPGDIVNFNTQKDISGNIKVVYKHLGEEIAEDLVTGSSWTWTAPGDDFKGYMAELYSNDSNQELLGAVAIDVSSNWSRFPRYGFLSDYGDLSGTQMEAIINNLNRHHINGIQFYDWQYKHHMPMAGTPDNPEPVWKEIANNDVYFSTLENYISLAHSHNMQAMFYNLAFGALNDASYDGVEEEWYIFHDQNHTEKDKHPLGNPPFKSDIFLLDPSNTNWINYMANKNDDVYKALDFDGFHIDQLGDRGTKYDYSGDEIDLPGGFNTFIGAMKDAHSEKDLVMNAVNQYAQERISKAKVEFLYTEVWNPNEQYESLANIIKENNNYSSNTKNTVLAAYMNYDLANSEGYFNTPAVLLTNAVIFAFGGSHLELGEHMLGKEYFLNNNLQMRSDLVNYLIGYYDFLVAYENLLRDGGTFSDPTIQSIDNKLSINIWPPSTGSVSAIGKEVNNSQVIHLINFSTSVHTNWRDNQGDQPYPVVVKDCELEIAVDKPVTKVWFATPDAEYGTSKEIKFSEGSNSISITLPSIEYWSMIVIEYN